MGDKGIPMTGVEVRLLELERRVAALENPPASPLYEKVAGAQDPDRRGEYAGTKPPKAGDAIPFGDATPGAVLVTTDIDMLKAAVAHIDDAVRLLSQNSILGSSMKDERKLLARLGLNFADVVRHYENPPPLPAGATVVAKRDDYPANDGVTTRREEVIEEAKANGCTAHFVESHDGANIYEFRLASNGAIVDFVVARGKERGRGGDAVVGIGRPAAQRGGEVMEPLTKADLAEFEAAIMARLNELARLIRAGRQ